MIRRMVDLILRRDSIHLEPEVSEQDKLKMDIELREKRVRSELNKLRTIAEVRRGA